jgi:hypothetical protein
VPGFGRRPSLANIFPTYQLSSLQPRDAENFLVWKRNGTIVIIVAGTSSRGT